jgi:uncharacterized protein YbjT (DUF2867 family)
MPRRNWNKVFVTGGTSFVGLRVVAALVEAGADVTVLVRPEHEEKLGALRRHIRLVHGDVWSVPSLKGRSRGHGAVIHLVGSLRAQPERGLTFHQLNLVSARNAIGMAVSDGVPFFVLLSAAHKPPGVPAEYLRSKREAEDYLRNSGLRWAIVRAPVVFDREQRGGRFFALLSRIGSLPLLRVFTGGRAPLPVEIAARGIAQAALRDELPRNQRLYAKHLRQLGRIPKSRRGLPVTLRPGRPAGDPDLDDEIPFGWLPPDSIDNE